jgi:putative membrane protein
VFIARFSKNCDMNKTLRKISIIAYVLFLAPTPCFAVAGELPAIWQPRSFGMALLATIVFGLAGIILALIGFKLFDLITPFNLEKEMCENKNVAVGVLCGAIVLGVCIIVAAAIV